MHAVRSVGLAVALILSTASAAADADAVTGLWLNADKTGYLEVYEKDGKYFGQVAGATDGDVKDDTENPDPAKRDQSLLGKDVLTGFEYVGDGKYENGEAYNPESGKTYSANMRLQDADHLKIRGYIGFSLLGQTETLTRASRDDKGVKTRVLKGE